MEIAVNGFTKDVYQMIKHRDDEIAKLKQDNSALKRYYKKLIAMLTEANKRRIEELERQACFLKTYDNSVAINPVELTANELKDEISKLRKQSLTAAELNSSVIASLNKKLLELENSFEKQRLDLILLNSENARLAKSCEQAIIEKALVDTLDIVDKAEANRSSVTSKTSRERSAFVWSPNWIVYKSKRALENRD